MDETYLTDDEKAYALIAVKHIWEGIDLGAPITQKVLDNGGYDITFDIIEDSAVCSRAIFKLLEELGEVVTYRRFPLPKRIRRLIKKELAALGKAIDGGKHFTVCQNLVTGRDKSKMAILAQEMVQTG